LRHLAPAYLGGGPFAELVPASAARTMGVERYLIVRTGDEVPARSACVRYRPFWRPGARVGGEQAGVLATGSVTDVFALGLTDRPELAAARAVTAYRVSATLDGVSVTYGAAFVWLPAGAAGDARVLVLDAVVQGVFEAMDEPVDPPLATDLEPTLRKAERNGRRPGRAGGPVIAASTDDVVCVPGDTTGSSIHTESSSQDHWYPGTSHHARSTFSHICRCTDTCEQTCITSIPQRECTDDGSVSGGGHYTFATAGTTRPTVSNGHQTPVTCAAGTGCVMKVCSFPFLCTATVSVIFPGGGGVSFSTTCSPDWEANFAYSQACAPCQVITQDDDDGSDTGNPGGGGGGDDEPVEDCSCDCDGDGWVTPEECIYDCDGMVNGEWCDV
jgi:hypothetical protein